MKAQVVRAQLIVFSILTVLIVSYTLFDILGVRIGKQNMNMKVVLPTGGGIFEGSEVTFRGVRVGDVKSIKLEADKVTLTLSVKPSAKIPNNAIATVTDLSAVGEQYLDFVPVAAKAPGYLTNGSVVPASQTKTPIRVSQVLYETSRWLDSMDPEKLAVLTKEFSAAFAQNGPQLRQILQGTTSLINQLSEVQPRLTSLLKNSSVLLKDAANHSAQFSQFAKDLEALSTTLKEVTPNFKSVLAKGAEFVVLVDEVMDESGAATAALLADGATFAQIQGARIPGLKALLLAVPEFGRNAQQVLASGKLRAYALINQNQPVCSYGLALTSPISGTKTPVHKVACTNGPPRGAVNAPRPGSTSTAAGTSTSLSGSADGPVQLTGYSQQGLIYPPDGSQPIQLGYTGGQDQILGAQSWQALLAGIAGN